MVDLEVLVSTQIELTQVKISSFQLHYLQVPNQASILWHNLRPLP